jgi:hypothetical protein
MRRTATLRRLGRFATMPLVSLAAAFAIALSAGSVYAQTPELDASRVQVLEHEARTSQVRALDAEREANAALERLRTEQTLRGLAQDRAASTPANSLLASKPTSPAPPGTVSTIDSQLVADSDRIMQLQRDALARSNARILAVRPAL